MKEEKPPSELKGRQRVEAQKAELKARVRERMEIMKALEVLKQSSYYKRIRNKIRSKKGSASLEKA